MKVIKQGNTYTVDFIVIGDGNYVANNVIIEFTTNPAKLTISNITAPVGVRDTNNYIIGNMLPNTSVVVTVTLLVVEEAADLNITGVVTADNDDILKIANNTKVLNLLTVTDGILATELHAALFGTLPEYDSYAEAAADLNVGQFARYSQANTDSVVSPNGSVIFQIQ